MDTGELLLDLSLCPLSALSLYLVILCRMDSPYLFYSPNVWPCSLPGASLPHITWSPTHSLPSPGNLPYLFFHCYTAEKLGLNIKVWSLLTSIHNEFSFLLYDSGGLNKKCPLKISRCVNISPILSWWCCLERLWNL